MIISLFIIFACLFVGDVVSAGLRLPIPGNVLGMVLLTTALRLKIVRLADVKPTADVLLQNLAFFFIPPGVGLLLYVDLLRSAWLTLTITLAVSTLLVLAVVGSLQQWLEKR